MPISDGRADGLDFRPATDARTIFSRNSLSGKGTAPSNPCLGMPYSVHSHYCFQASDEDEPATRAQRLPERSSERTDNRGGRASEAEIAEATYHTKRYEKAHRTDTLPYGMPDRRRAVRPVLRHGRRLSERTLRHASPVEPESSATIHRHKENPHTERRVTAQAEGHGPESPGRGRLGIFQSDNGRRRKTEQTVQAGPAVRRSDFFPYMDEKPIYECHVGRIHVRNHRQHALFRPGKTLLLLLESANRRIQASRQRLPVRSAGGISRFIRELSGRAGAEPEKNARRLFHQILGAGKTGIAEIRFFGGGPVAEDTTDQRSD